MHDTLTKITTRIESNGVLFYTKSINLEHVSRRGFLLKIAEPGYWYVSRMKLGAPSIQYFDESGMTITTFCNDDMIEETKRVINAMIRVKIIHFTANKDHAINVGLGKYLK